MITLTTDFGGSAYVGALRGSILSVAPKAQVVDLTHGVPSHDVLEGAFALFEAAPIFPEGTVHVAVVDPGVGTDRAGLALQAGDHLFVGPDNGLLLPVARRLGFQAAVELDEPRYWRSPVSTTFHGRDIFGPVGAHLSLGVPLEEVGSPVDEENLEELGFGEPFIEEGTWACEVLRVDPFGNATTNLPGASVLDEVDFGAEAVFEIDGERVEGGVHRTYGDASGNRPFVTIGSSGLAELSLREDSFADRYNVRPGDEVKVQFLPREDPVEGALQVGE